MELKTMTAEALLEGIRSGQGIFSRLRRHPEAASVFRKYGTPEETAALIRTGSKDIFFDNGTLCMTDDFLFDSSAPAHLLRLQDVLAAYGELRGKDEYLVVHDRWGDVFRYPFAVGQKQVFKIGILVDKIQKASPRCRRSHRAEDMEYIRQHTEPLP